MFSQQVCRWLVSALRLACSVPVLFLIISEASAESEKPIRIRVVTTPVISPLVTHQADRPGLLIELFNRVEPLANVRFDYSYLPWDQCLRMVRTGLANGVFSASYRQDRAEYGDYPFRDGILDETRAFPKPLSN